VEAIRLPSIIQGETEADSLIALDSLWILTLNHASKARRSEYGRTLVRPKVASREADRYYEGEVMMITNPVHSSPTVQNEAAAKAAPRQNAAPQQASVPQDKVTISPQAHAQVQVQVHAQRAVSADKNHGGDSK
jgi:hypothetical protein